MNRKDREWGWQQCSNCEGEGKVVLWLAEGEEVPASRKVKYPDEAPDNPNTDTTPYECPVCDGGGEYTYIEGRKVTRKLRKL